MGNKPEGYSIERMNVNGNYCKENCCWIPKSKQNNNKRTTRLDKHKANRIREYYWAGFRVFELAKLYSVNWSTIDAVVKNRRWIPEVNI